MFEFDWENTWRQYKEFALVPAIIVFYDSDLVYNYYSMTLQFLNIRIAVTYRK
jgi:hypothetical protein